MDPTLEYILELGGGPVAVLAVVAYLALPWYRRHVKAIERDIIIRRWHLQFLKGLTDWLKGQGHEIETPDLTKDI